MHLWQSSILSNSSACLPPPIKKWTLSPKPFIINIIGTLTHSFPINLIWPLAVGLALIVDKIHCPQWKALEANGREFWVALPWTYWTLINQRTMKPSHLTISSQYSLTTTAFLCSAFLAKKKKNPIKFPLSRVLKSGSVLSPLPGDRHALLLSRGQDAAAGDYHNWEDFEGHNCLCCRCWPQTREGHHCG